MINKYNIDFGISQKSDGQMILRDKVGLPHREKYFKSRDINTENVISTELVHGNHVTAIAKEDAGKIIKKTDGLITNVKNLCLTVTVSDCLPIFFYDKKNEIIGIAHAGWRGVIDGIALNLAKQMKKKYKIEFETIEVTIGPHIKKCHFEIKDDIVDTFKDYPESIIYSENKIFVDLEMIIKEQLISLGIKNNNININPDCTYCNKNYFSYRRDKPRKVSSQIAYIRLSPNTNKKEHSNPICKTKKTPVESFLL